VPADKAAPAKKWLQGFGIGSNAASVASSGVSHTTLGDILFKVEADDSTSQSAVYITSKWDSDMNVNSSKLSCAIQSGQGGGQGGGERSYGSGSGAGNKSDTLNSASWKISEHVAQVAYKKYEAELNSACNIYSPEELAIMIYRYMDSNVTYPKFGKVPCGRGFQSWHSIMASLGCDVLNMCDIDHEYCDKFVDRLDKTIAPLISKDRYSYSVPAWTFSNRGGNVFSFGVEPRFLLFVRAVISNNPAVSQTSIQGIFDHFVRQTVRHRIPATLFPYCTLFTGLPDSESLGLSLAKVDDDEMYKSKPATLLRALPCNSVKEMSNASISGVLHGEMVEDIAHLNKFKRVATMLNVSLDELHLEDLTTPHLPSYSWIFCESVYKSSDGDQSQFDAAQSPFHKIAVYIDSKRNRVFRYASSETFCRQDDVLSVTDLPARGQEDFCSPSRCEEFPSIVDALAPTMNAFTRFAPIYNRPGTLIYLPNIGYLVLAKWPLQRVHTAKAIEYPLWLSGHWFDPRTMTYMAQMEGLDVEEDASYIRHLQLGPLHDRVQSSQTSASEAVLHLPLYDTDKDSDQDQCDSDDMICSQDPQKILHFFKNTAEMALSLSSWSVQKHMVPVGSVLYLDPMHPAMPDDIIKHLRFKKHTASGEITLAPNVKKVRGADLATFNSSCLNHNSFYPAVECMLLYEMPEPIVPHNECCDVEFQLWVGVRQLLLSSTKAKYVTRYVTVPTKMIIAQAKLKQAGISLAIFNSCV